MKALTAALATACENAKNKRCNCRCRGEAHGLARFADETEAAGLPDWDPHHTIGGGPGPGEPVSPPREVPPDPRLF